MEEEPPHWLAGQTNILNKMMAMIADVQTSIGTIKDELAQAKFQASVAQTVAEEAVEKVEALETRVFEKIQTLEERIPDAQMIRTMVGEAVREAKHHVPTSFATKGDVNSKDIYGITGSIDEKFSRTLVVGGFARDTPKKTIINYIQEFVVKDFLDVEEVFAYNYGNVGFVRFKRRESMFDFLKDFNKREEKTMQNQKPVWLTVSKTPEERRKSKHLSKFKKALIETGVTQPTDVLIDYKRGIIFVKHIRVAEWKETGDDSKISIDPVKLKDAKIMVDPKIIHDAVNELLRE